MIFSPEFEAQPWAKVNLDEEARLYQLAQGLDPENLEYNPLLDPNICQQMVDDVHRKLGVVWSCGGYQEDRRHLWGGKKANGEQLYLSDKNSFLHLGWDFNAKKGTPVQLKFPVRVMHKDHDRDKNGGWGPRVFVQRLEAGYRDHYIILAHLEDIRCKVGKIIRANQPFAVVGEAPDNGNWYDHAHVQLAEVDFIDQLLESPTQAIYHLDGYKRDTPEDRRIIKHLYPDALPYLLPWEEAA